MRATNRTQWIESSAIDAIDRWHADLARLQRDVATIEPNALTGDDRVVHAVLEAVIAQSVGDVEYRTYLMPFGPTWGPDLWLASTGYQRDQWTLDELEAYVIESRAYATYFRNIRTRMQIGLAEGITPPRVTLVDLPDRIDARLGPDALDNLSEPFRRADREADRVRFEAIWRDFSRGLRATRRELETFHAFIRDEYVPGCRDSIAVADLPRGDLFYQHLLRTVAETTLSPRELHELGRSEVARLHTEAIPCIRRLDLLPDAIDPEVIGHAAYYRRAVAALAADPDRRFSDAEELLRSARNVSKRIDEQLPALFSTLPRLPYAIVSAPADHAGADFAGYTEGSMEQGRPSYLTFNTTNMERLPPWCVTPLVLHEGMPGHHLQVALAHEGETTHAFRKTAWFAGFGEGWAMYAEWLGIEIGLYDEPLDEFGRIASEVHRACRLVVDPGMHALGWSREEAITFMNEHSALPPASVVADVDRMIAWPGQACAYTVNGLRFRTLRRAAETALGPRFDARAFHDAAIRNGAVPMSLIERQVNRWIEDQATPTSPSHDADRGR
ncbi:MAG: DUF885 domain-containing protein [Phycisphaerales bacterium]|nr:DUF885 domain-containing protein [Phycisphaerales bacterium]